MASAIKEQERKRSNLSFIVNFRKGPFKRYVPVAEGMMSLIEQAEQDGHLDKRKSYILRKIVLGNTLSNIGREMDISRQRVYELELKALDKLHGYHSPLIHRFDKFRGRAEFDSEVAMSRVRKIAKRTKRKWISKSLKTAGYKYKKYYRSAKEKVLREYHQKPENIGKRMLRDFKFVRARVESILKRVEKTEAHIKRYFF